MKKIILALIIILSINNTFAVVTIEQGQPAPFKGVLFNLDEEKKVRQINEEKLKLEDLKVLYEQRNEVQQLRIENLQSTIENNKSMGTWEKVGWFAAGFITSSVVLYTSAKIIQMSK